MTERPMRRKDRQFSAADARAILAKGTHGVLSVVGDGGWPYAVPMNYTVMGTQIYLHCARAGYKLDAIARDDRVCFTVVTQAQVIPAHITTLYESVVVLGRAQVGEKGVLAGGEGEPADIRARDGRAVQRDRAAVIADERQDALHERRLARAVLAEQADDLAGPDRQAHVIERLLVSIALAEILDFQHQKYASQICKVSAGGMQRAGTPW